LHSSRSLIIYSFFFWNRDREDDHLHAASQDVSREQLDSLIEAGDWAAVGATAALLAAASDSQSATSRASSRSRQSSENNSVDAARAAELDHLVDAGDWEGVVLAAAKFEAAEAAGGTGSSRGSRTNSSVDESTASGDSATGGATGSSPSVSESKSGSDDPSKAKKRAEIREEVEALVRRVVPEEIDNVDEMMNQFKGREEELVETLRTMQERAVAQKARAAGHKAAKVEARRSVQRGVVPGASAQRVPPSAQAGVAAAAALAQIGDSDQSTISGADTTGEASVANVRSALEMAIETGDWAAVGDAAAMMSDASTLSTSEINRMAHTNISVSTEGTRSRQSLDGVNAARAAELDAMIDRGDWSGVIAAANRYTKTDKSSIESSPAGRTKEEEEALAQAEIWMKIAEQKKAEGATDAGASDAAEWAIHRSLSQLKMADKKKDSNRSNKGGDEDEV
jgi:hypothetical protein